jgi:hypothetical protein
MMRSHGSLKCSREHRFQTAIDRCRFRRSSQSPVVCCAANIKQRILEQFEGRAEAYDAGGAAPHLGIIHTWTAYLLGHSTHVLEHALLSSTAQTSPK